MEEGFSEQGYKVRDTYNAVMSSVRGSDSKLSEMIVEETSKCYQKAAEIGGSFQGHIDNLQSSADQSLTFVQTLISDVSDKHQRNYSSLCDRFNDLDSFVKIRAQENVAVRQQVNEIRTIPLIRGALNRGA